MYNSEKKTRQAQNSTKITIMNDQIKLIRQEMEKILLTPNGKDGNFRPIKGTTKTQCYNVLGKIQSILETNKITI